MYGLASVMLSCPPDEPLLASLEGWTSMLLTSDGFDCLPLEMRESIKKLNELFRRNSITAIQQEAIRDFTGLFRGVKKSFPPPAYESAYTEGRTFGSSTCDVSGYYRNMHLEVIKNLRYEPQDHVSFELEFMSILCEQEALARETNERPELERIIEIEEKFLSNHLLNWFPDLCKKVSEHDSFGFYTHLTLMIQEWLKLDSEHISCHTNLNYYVKQG